MIDNNIGRNEYNKALSNIKKLVLNGFSDENYTIIQSYMTLIKPYTEPRQYNLLGEIIRDGYTDSVSIKNLNQLIRNMKLEDIKE